MTQQFITNRAALADLLDWLDKGAPTVTFDMSVGISFGNARGTGDCGTSCCIAGAAAARATGLFGKYLTFEMVSKAFADTSYNQAWVNVPEKAIEYLGIDLDALPRAGIHNRYVIDLFSDQDAPYNCTPAQAAQAVRNFDATGTADWDAIKAEIEPE